MDQEITLQKLHSIAVDTEGNIYITGTSWGGNVTKLDFVTVKYNSVGELAVGAKL